MDDIIGNINYKKAKWKSILQKINHKPLIVENIFSFVKDELYKFLNLIEKDNDLKQFLNSIFSIKDKSIDFPKQLKENIQLLKLFKFFQEKLKRFKNKNEIIIDKEAYEEYISENHYIDPSFLVLKSTFIINQIKKEKEFEKYLSNISITSLIDIAFYEQEKYGNIQIVLLPLIKNKYKDGLYISKNLDNENKANKCSNKEIDILYCIIDDNEYYLEQMPLINKDILLKEIYFIYIKGTKKININKAIEVYLSLLNKKNIKKINLGNILFCPVVFDINAIDQNFIHMEL